MEKLLSFVKLYFLQFLLSVFAVFSFFGTLELGNRFISETISGETFVSEPQGFNSKEDSKNVAIALSSGYNGGALGMSLISCSCIIGIVLLELKKS